MTSNNEDITITAIITLTITAAFLAVVLLIFYINIVIVLMAIFTVFYLSAIAAFGTITKIKEATQWISNKVLTRF